MFVVCVGTLPALVTVQLQAQLSPPFKLLLQQMSQHRYHQIRTLLPQPLDAGAEHLKGEVGQWGGCGFKCVHAINFHRLESDSKTSSAFGLGCCGQTHPASNTHE